MRPLKLALVVPLLVTLSGCEYRDDDRFYDPPYLPDDGEVHSAAIDTGATLADIEAGEGAGAFVEYAGDGSWHIFTACDTSKSQISCQWDIIASVLDGSQISDYATDRLEQGDQIIRQTEDSVNLVTTNSYDFDGIHLKTEPGATLRVDVFLDGQPAPRYIYWVSGGGLNRGSPTNPIDLTPDAP